MLKSCSHAQNEAPEPAPQGTAFIPAIDGGLLSLTLVAEYYRIACHPAQMAHDLGLGQRIRGGLMPDSGACSRKMRGNQFTKFMKYYIKLDGVHSVSLTASDFILSGC